jgi:hypothetical protein
MKFVHTNRTGKISMAESEKNQHPGKNNGYPIDDKREEQQLG